MQDVEKTEIQRDTSTRRLRRRNRLRPIYGLLVAALVIGVGIALSMTLFFNIQTIEVAGDAPQYTAEEIAQASGVHTGDNMMRLNRADVEQHILDRLVFVDDVTIKKQFPDVLVISVSPSQAAFNVVDDSGTLQVSAAGKILKNGPETDAALPVITGFEPAVRDPGQMLASKDSQKDQIFQTLTTQMAKGLSFSITQMNLKDKYDLVITFDNRVDFSLGNWSEMDYKITLAETVLAQLSTDKVGYLTMVGDHQCSYRDKEDVAKQTTAAITDENGAAVSETDADGNPISTTTETTVVANDWQ